MVAITVAGCGTDFRPAVRALTPLNGATAVETDVLPAVEVASGAQVDAGGGRVTLVERVAGGVRTVAGEIEIVDNRLTYRPEQPLLEGRRYELVVEQDALRGKKLLDVDASESPQEPLQWPLRARFLTASAPQVRGVYLEPVGRRGRLLVRFSQPMDQVVSNDQFLVIDQISTELSLGKPVWIDEASVRLDIDAELDEGGLYTLQINRDARGRDGSHLDGDADGRAGESDDNFVVQFTGSQRIVLSRLRGEDR